MLTHIGRLNSLIFSVVATLAVGIFLCSVKGSADPKSKVEIVKQHLYEMDSSKSVLGQDKYGKKEGLTPYEDEALKKLAVNLTQLVIDVQDPELQDQNLYQWDFSLRDFMKPAKEIVTFVSQEDRGYWYKSLPLEGRTIFIPQGLNTYLVELARALDHGRHFSFNPSNYKADAEVNKGVVDIVSGIAAYVRNEPVTDAEMAATIQTYSKTPAMIDAEFEARIKTEGNKLFVGGAEAVSGAQALVSIAREILALYGSQDFQKRAGAVDLFKNKTMGTYGSPQYSEPNIMYRLTEPFARLGWTSRPPDEPVLREAVLEAQCDLGLLRAFNHDLDKMIEHVKSGSQELGPDLGGLSKNYYFGLLLFFNSPKVLNEILPAVLKIVYGKPNDLQRVVTDYLSQWAKSVSTDYLLARLGALARGEPHNPLFADGFDEASHLLSLINRNRQAFSFPEVYRQELFDGLARIYTDRPEQMQKYLAADPMRNIFLTELIEKRRVPNLISDDVKKVAAASIFDDPNHPQKLNPNLRDYELHEYLKMGVLTYGQLVQVVLLAPRGSEMQKEAAAARDAMVQQTPAATVRRENKKIMRALLNDPQFCNLALRQLGR